MATSDTPVKYPYFDRWYTISDGSSLPFLLGSTVEQRSFGSGVSRVTRNSDSNWKVKVRKKLDASNDYYRHDWEFDVPVTRCTTRQIVGTPNKITSYYSNRYSGDVPTAFPSTDATYDDIALKRLKAKISSHQADFQALVPVVELRELRGAIRNSADLTADFLRSIINIKKTKGASAFKFVSQAWLNYGFGIAPLVSDTKKAADAIKEFLLRNDHTIVLSGSAEKNWASGSCINNAFGPHGAFLRCQQEIHHTLSYRYQGGFNFLLSSANNYGAVENFHLNLGALPSVAWELTAFSWVVDYFANVGEYLEDVFIGTPVKLLYLNRCRKYEARGVNHLTFKPTSGANYRIVESKNGDVNWRYFEFQRTALSALPHRTLRFKTIDEVGLGSLNKLFNLVSILGSGIHIK